MIQILFDDDILLNPNADEITIDAKKRLKDSGVRRTLLFAVAPWLLLSPWMASLMERRTTRAVDRLVSGMAGARARAT